MGGVVHKASGEISIPSDSNKDLALFLMFFGVATSFPIRALVERVLPTQHWTWLLGPLGFAMVVAGILFLGFTRKRFWVDGKSVRIKDGMFGNPLRYTWEEPPKVRLKAVEEERGREHVELWQVYLVDGKRQYLMDRREGHQIECRSLAEALAKTINCPVLEATEAGEITIPREELDLPFRERVARYPDLLGPEVPPPQNCRVKVQESDGEHRYRWNLLNQNTLNEYMTLVVLIVLLAIVPIFKGAPHGHDDPESFQRSYFMLARERGHYMYFYVTGAILGISAFLLFGYSKELRLSKQGVAAQDSLWGVPVWSASIPSQELEEIWVRQSTRGAHLQLISDRCIIDGRISSSAVASWMASRIRRYFTQSN